MNSINPYQSPASVTEPAASPITLQGSPPSLATVAWISMPVFLLNVVSNIGIFWKEPGSDEWWWIGFAFFTGIAITQAFLLLIPTMMLRGARRWIMSLLLPSAAMLITGVGLCTAWNGPVSNEDVVAITAFFVVTWLSAYAVAGVAFAWRGIQVVQVTRELIQAPNQSGRERGGMSVGIGIGIAMTAMLSLSAFTLYFQSPRAMVVYAIGFLATIGIMTPVCLSISTHLHPDTLFRGSRFAGSLLASYGGAFLAFGGLFAMVGSTPFSQFSIWGAAIACGFAYGTVVTFFCLTVCAWMRHLGLRLENTHDAAETQQPADAISFVSAG